MSLPAICKRSSTNSMRSTKCWNNCAAEAKGDAKKDLDEKVKLAQAKRRVAAKHLDELKEASHERWEKVKDGLGNALDDLKKQVE